MKKPLNSYKEHESWEGTIAGRLLSKEEVFGKAREKHSALKAVEKDLK